MNEPKISAVVLVKNEERNIRDCLTSLKWTDEIVLLDDESTDGTLKIAETFGAKVFKRRMDIEGRHRNYAYSKASNDWVISIDAD
ncbi:MAG: glycosyltransferase [Candidatus Omnitrophica bacterium]|nr:glycosyltransferase [Candidatus Omnitrophota bacterium]